MDDSLRGVLVTLTLISLFITAILSFITLFPQSQGYTFSDNPSKNTYLVVQNSIDPSATTTQLTNIDTSTNTGFNQWDVTQGFMGSNTVKQTSAVGVRAYGTSIFTSLSIIATQVFSQNSPIVYAIGIFLILTLGYILYLTIQFVRQGR